MQSCGMADGMVFTPGVPGFPPGASWTTRDRHKKPPAVAGGLRVACLPACHAIRVRSACRLATWPTGWCSRPESPGFHPGLLGRSPINSRSKGHDGDVRREGEGRPEPCPGSRRRSETSRGRMPAAVPDEKWTGPESNRRHTDFQSVALPTELPVRSHTPRKTGPPAASFVGCGRSDVNARAPRAEPTQVTAAAPPHRAPLPGRPRG